MPVTPKSPAVQWSLLPPPPVFVHGAASVLTWPQTRERTARNSLKCSSCRETFRHCEWLQMKRAPRTTSIKTGPTQAFLSRGTIYLKASVCIANTVVFDPPGIFFIQSWLRAAHAQVSLNVWLLAAHVYAMGIEMAAEILSMFLWLIWKQSKRASNTVVVCLLMASLAP